MFGEREKYFVYLFFAHPSMVIAHQRKSGVSKMKKKVSFSSRSNFSFSFLFAQSNDNTLNS